MPAPSYVAKSTLSVSTTDKCDIAYIASVPAGDWLFALLLTYQEPGGSIGDITPDEPGWLEIGGGVGFRDNTPNNVGSLKLFRKIADGTETGSATFSRTGSTGGSNAFVGQMYQFTGTNIQLISSAFNILGDGAATIDWPAVSVIGTETTAIAFVGQMTDDPGTPAGYVNEASDSSGGIVAYLECNVEEDSSGGTASASNGSADGWATIHISIFNSAGYLFIPDH